MTRERGWLERSEKIVSIRSYCTINRTIVREGRGALLKCIDYRWLNHFSCFHLRVSLVFGGVTKERQRLSSDSP